MLVCNYSQNSENHGFRKRASFCLKAVKGLCKETVNQHVYGMLYIHQNIFTITGLAVLLTTTIGVLLRTMLTTHGTRTSTMATRTTTIRTTAFASGRFGVLNKAEWSSGVILIRAFLLVICN